VVQSPPFQQRGLQQCGHFFRSHIATVAFRNIQLCFFFYFCILCYHEIKLSVGLQICAKCLHSYMLALNVMYCCITFEHKVNRCKHSIHTSYKFCLSFSIRFADSFVSVIIITVVCLITEFDE